MRNLLTAILIPLTIALGSPLWAEDAIKIAPDGSVTIPGQLTAGSVDAGNITKALADIAAQNAQIIAQNAQTIGALEWTRFAGSVGEAFQKIEADPSLLNTQEFMMSRNGQMRHITFSTWNAGWRLMTEPYMTGDNEPFVLGGSMWIYKTLAPNAAKCSPPQAWHNYYQYTTGGANKNLTVQSIWGNNCRAELPVYTRKYLFE